MFFGTHRNSDGTMISAPAEQGKRQSILFVMAQVGNLFSGYLQASVYHLGGISGMSGWRYVSAIHPNLLRPLKSTHYHDVDGYTSLTAA